MEDELNCIHIFGPGLNAGNTTWESNFRARWQDYLVSRTGDYFFNTNIFNTDFLYFLARKFCNTIFLYFLTLKVFNTDFLYFLARKFCNRIFLYFLTQIFCIF